MLLLKRKHIFLFNYNSRGYRGEVVKQTSFAENLLLSSCCINLPPRVWAFWETLPYLEMHADADLLKDLHLELIHFAYEPKLGVKKLVKITPKCNMLA